MKKILITGAKGFIGSHLCDHFKEKYQLYGYDFEDLNLLEAETVGEFLKKRHFDVIIHTATLSDTRISPRPQQEVLANNLKMFFNLVGYHHDFGKLIYYGSGAEYGRETLPAKVTEDYFKTVIPQDVYGLSKFIMAQYALTDANVFELIPFAVFGPGEDWRIRFISNACCRQIFGLPITIKQNAVYDYLYIDDLVKITEWFVNQTPSEHRYHLCSGKPYDLYSLAKMIQKFSSEKKEIRVARAGLGRQYSGSNDKLRRLIPDLCLTKMEEAISSTYQWYLKNKALINKNELSFDSQL